MSRKDFLQHLFVPAQNTQLVEKAVAEAAAQGVGEEELVDQTVDYALNDAHIIENSASISLPAEPLEEEKSDNKPV